MIYLVPETNFLRLPYKENTDYTKFYLNQNFEKLDRLRRVNSCSEELVLAIPELVCKELHQQKYEAYKVTCEQVQMLFNCLGDYGKAEIFLTLQEYAQELDEQIKAFIANHELTIIPICDNICFESIVDRAIRKKAPFLGHKKESDKGFKDTVIWYSLLSFATRNPGEYIFITNDNIFHDELMQLKNEFFLKTGSNIYIYREYEEVLQHISVKATKKYIDSAYVNTEIREIILKHANEDYFVRLKYTQPRIFAEEDVLTFINHDIKRIYDNAYLWWDGFDFSAYEENNDTYEGSMDFTITYNSNGIIAFLFHGEIYLGGPHGSPEQIGKVYELSTGNAIGLCELLGKDEKEILDLVLNKWQQDKEKRGDDVYWDNFQPKYETVDDIRFYMDDKGIHVFFDVYEAACYAEGFVEFLLADGTEIVAVKRHLRGST